MRFVELGTQGGEVVVFLHGYTDSSLSFGPLIDALLARRPDLRVLLPDLRGHGGSSLPPAEDCAPAPELCLGVQDFARDVVALLEHLQIERAHLIGHSFGSMAAQDVALMAPDRIASLVLLGSSARMVGNPVIEQFIVAQLLEDTWRPALEARGARWPDDVYRLTALDVDPAAEDWLLSNWVTEIAADPAYLTELAARTADVPLGTWLGAGRALLAFDNVDRLGELSVPTLVLWGSQDVATPEADQVLLRSALDVASRRCGTSYVWKRYGREPLPASGLQESNFGHNFHWGAPEQVAADLAAWLDDGTPTADLHFVDPSDRHTVVTVPGAAELLGGPACS